MRFQEDSEGFWRQSVNYLRLRGHRRIWQELRRRRQELAAEIGTLARSYLEMTGHQAPTDAA